MAARRIRQLGDPILRVRCTPVEDPKSPAVRLLSDDLRDTLRTARKKYDFGRALASSPWTSRSDSIHSRFGLNGTSTTSPPSVTDPHARARSSPGYIQSSTEVPRHDA